MNFQARRDAPGSIVQIVTQTKPVIKAPKKPVKKTVETFVPVAQDFPDSISAAETRKRRGVDLSIPSMPHKKPAASVSVQQLTDPVPPKAALSRHCTWGKQKTLDKQPEVEEPELATITDALQAAWSLLADITQGDRRLIPALTKMIEAAVDATNATDVMQNDRHDLRIVSWNAQGANMETARIQDAVQKDSIDVLMF